MNQRGHYSAQMAHSSLIWGRKKNKSVHQIANLHPADVQQQDKDIHLEHPPFYIQQEVKHKCI